MCGRSRLLVGVAGVVQWLQSQWAKHPDLQSRLLLQSSGFYLSWRLSEGRRSYRDRNPQTVEPQLVVVVELREVYQQIAAYSLPGKLPVPVAE